jgi:hypothetical protein
LKRLALVLALAAGPAWAISPEAQEFIELSAKLEPVQCEKRKLRRDMALAEVERDEAKAKQLRARFDAIDRDKETSRLEARLAQLHPRIVDAEGKPRRPEDLDAISLQRREAFYRCR